MKTLINKKMFRLKGSDYNTYHIIAHNSVDAERLLLEYIAEQAKPVINVNDDCSLTPPSTFKITELSQLFCPVIYE